MERGQRRRRGGGEMQERGEGVDTMGEGEVEGMRERQEEKRIFHWDQ